MRVEPHGSAVSLRKISTKQLPPYTTSHMAASFELAAANGAGVRKRYVDDVAREATTDFPQSLKGKKVLLISESLGPVNGVSRTTGSLINYLREHEVQVAIVAPKYDGIRSIWKRKATHTDPEVRLHGYPLPTNPDLLVAYPFRIDRLYNRTFHPDIVYLASPATVGFQFLLQMRQLQYPPTVLANFQTDLSAYGEIIFVAPFDKWVVWLMRTVEGFLFSHRAVHTVFYPSSGVQKYLEKAGTPAQKLVRLGRGVDTELFNPHERDEAYRKELAPNGEVILLCVGRVAPEKGFEFLAKVALQLKKNGLKFRLVIVGGNKNPAIEEDVRRMFKPLGDSVIFTGFRQGKELARQYASADLFLHCSITETFGLVVLESMACKIPVIARDLGGPSEIVHDGESGFLVPPEDLSGFVGRVEQLVNDHELRNTMAEYSRKVALDTTWEKINSRVAWRIADALENKPENPERFYMSRTSRLMKLLGLSDAQKDALLSLVSIVRRELAIVMVFIAWGVVIIPMLVYGVVYLI